MWTVILEKEIADKLTMNQYLNAYIQHQIKETLCILILTKCQSKTDHFISDDFSSLADEEPGRPEKVTRNIIIDGLPALHCI